MKDAEIKFWEETGLKIIQQVEEVVKPLIGTFESGKIVKIGADGTPTTLIDMVAEKKVVNALEELEMPVFLISEEIGEVKIGQGPPEVILVVDPLDGTSNAIKKIPAYGISMALAPAPPNPQQFSNLQDICLGMVKNFATGDLYSGLKGVGAFLNREKIESSLIDDVTRSSVGAYIYRGDMNRLEPLCKTVRRMRTLGAVAIEISYVADGTYDAFVDMRDNLRVVDVAAAKIIVEESGGIVTNRHSRSLDARLGVLEKTSVVASGNEKLHENILRILGGI
ncbi:MAG: bifunctional fructose-bisphosphatase/inositol-phosphate phosphatase [Methanobacteriaceae archaeon]